MNKNIHSYNFNLLLIGFLVIYYFPTYDFQFEGELVRIYRHLLISFTNYCRVKNNAQSVVYANFLLTQNK